jgi:hypothetical protein
MLLLVDFIDPLALFLFKPHLRILVEWFDDEGLGLVGGVKPRKLIENCPGSMQCILCTCRTTTSRKKILKIIFSNKFSPIDSQLAITVRFRQ